MPNVLLASRSYNGKSLVAAMMQAEIRCNNSIFIATTLNKILFSTKNKHLLIILPKVSSVRMDLVFKLKNVITNKLSKKVL